jgi:hypothetical protein
MKIAMIPWTLRAVAAFALAGAACLPAAAAPYGPPASKPAAKGCEGKIWVDPGQNPSSGHSYVLMMVFKKDTGSKYFGGADYSTTGCIGVVKPIEPIAKAGAKAKTKLSSDEEVYPAEVCPTDCTDPPDDGGKAARAKGAKGAKVGMTALEKGTDPLGKANYGVLSALETANNTPVPDNKFEVWQVRVKDACVARQLFLHYSEKGQFLNAASAAGEFLGQMMVGYRFKEGGATEACK